MGGSFDEWIDGWIIDCKDIRMDGWLIVKACGWMGGWMDGWMDGWTGDCG